MRLPWPPSGAGPSRCGRRGLLGLPPLPMASDAAWACPSLTIVLPLPPPPGTDVVFPPEPRLFPSSTNQRALRRTLRQSPQTALQGPAPQPIKQRRG